MSWYNSQGNCQCYVLFSKVRYIRNLAKQLFYPLAEPKKRDETLSKLESILQKNGFRGEKTAHGATPSMISLAEKQFVERDFVYSDRPRALYLNEPCNLLVALGGDNYITVSSVTAGLSVGEARNMASGAEEIIDKEVAFAYAEGIGYLSPVCSDCGSGISFSAALYLPTLSLSSSSPSLHSLIRCDKMALSPMLSGQNAGDIYILTYTPHYLSDEDSAASYFENTVSMIAEHERSLIMTEFKDAVSELYTKARRALGTLLYSDAISECEMLSLLSDIRLYHCISGERDSSLPSVSALTYLCCEGLNCSVISSAKEKCLSQAECDAARACLVSSYIEHKKEVS